MAKRLNLNLSTATYKDLHLLAVKTGGSITKIIQYGLGLAKIAVEETEQGNKLIVVSKNGDALKEICLPIR